MRLATVADCGETLAAKMRLALAINDAVARGVAVMTFDSDAPQSKRFAYYGVDDLATGEQTTIALTAMAIHGMGKKAVSLTGAQAGIITDGVQSITGQFS